MKKIKTGIARLDDILGGGIPELSVNFIAGPPGSGKTVLAQNMAFNLAREGMRTLYVTTLSESQFKVVRNLSFFSFFDEGLLGERVLFRDISEVLRLGGLSEALGAVDSAVREFRPHLLMIDSFKAMRDLCERESEFRSFVFELATRLSVWEVTSFFLGEYELEELSRLSEFAVADGILYLCGDREVHSRKRYLRIVKMRASGHDLEEHVFRIGKRGIEVFPRLRPEASKLTRHSFKERKGFGIPWLDELCGGGLPEGTLTLLVGDSGVGKSLLGLKFLFEGALRGERGLFISFEEPVSQLVANASSLGWDLRPFMRERLLRINFVSPIGLDLDIHGSWILSFLQRERIERLFVDSLTVFERNVSSAAKYKDFLWALSNLMKCVGTTAVFAVLSHGGMEGVVSGTGVSSLADNIVLMRYREAGGEVRKVLTVLKMRGSSHSRRLWWYDISPGDGLVSLGPAG